ncbi:hypothetical protein F2P81_011088 [Scophthalmus maximus]|uniref:Uncharacterized protein n=1 Tax=Scophthalmus maximus TaxID=52904 RepID=A0A6A4SKK7_SCOMX|nr:hypothetical protein F2P81_011088 [Scophthalmus maximus]
MVSGIRRGSWFGAERRSFHAAGGCVVVLSALVRNRVVHTVCFVIHLTELNWLVLLRVRRWICSPDSRHHGVMTSHLTRLETIVLVLTDVGLLLLQ